MVVGGGVEPGLELHLLVADAVGVDVGVEGVGLPGHVAQELVVDLVVVVAERGRLHRRRTWKREEANFRQINLGGFDKFQE